MMPRRPERRRDYTTATANQRARAAHGPLLQASSCQHACARTHTHTHTHTPTPPLCAYQHHVFALDTLAPPPPKELSLSSPSPPAAQTNTHY